MRPRIHIVPLGAGQDVGRSCLLLTIGGRNIMLDCGLHMGLSDHRRFPDFSYISKTGDYTNLLDAIIISHFHLDHCGALPYFTEVCGYEGPIYMTYPTRAICPLLLEDMRKVVVERRGETNFFTSADIANCMRKVIPVSLHSTVVIDEGLEIKAYYAGHVLGAAMFQIKCGDASVVYTGDFNTTPDRHLGAAWIDKCRPDVLITESTYATTIRPSKRAREKEFLQQVHECVSAGGKVLVPVFALGRAQELCILVDQYWDRMTLNCPVYFSAGLTERANDYYKLFVNWTNENIKASFTHRNMFDFKHIKNFDTAWVDEPGPMVLFASPGMLHAGLSLDVFKKWCGDPKNMIILPGYCVPGTAGAKVLAGERRIEVEKNVWLDVRMQVRNLSFSAHADAKGIVQIVQMCEPRNVVLVHGEAKKMGPLKKKILDETGVPAFDPANGVTVSFDVRETMPAVMSREVINRAVAAEQLLWENHQRRRKTAAAAMDGPDPVLKKRDPLTEAIQQLDAQSRAGGLVTGPPRVARLPFKGVAVVVDERRKGDDGEASIQGDYARVMDLCEVDRELGLEEFALTGRVNLRFDPSRVVPRPPPRGGGVGPDPARAIMRLLFAAIDSWRDESPRAVADHRPQRVDINGRPEIMVGPVVIRVAKDADVVVVEWDQVNQDFAMAVVRVVEKTLASL